MMKIPAARVFFSPEDRAAICRQIDQVLQSGALTLGELGKRFEVDFAARAGTRHAIAVNSGTSALEIVLRCWDVAGRKVIVPTNTFLATALAAWHAGAEVVLADVGDDLCLDPEAVERLIDDRTAAVIHVHIGGAVTPVVERVRDLCRARGVKLLEDAAHAHGAALAGRHAGAFGDAASFSFYPTKIMTSGEGGMIVTDDDELDQRARVFRDQGKAGFLGNVHTELGYNWRMSEVHAAIGLTHLGRLDEFVAERRRLARVYDAGLANMRGVTALRYPDQVSSSYYKYIALLDRGIDRAGLKKRLREELGVSLSGEVYELPVHLQPVVERLQGKGAGRLPRAEELCSRHICLPLYPNMTEAEASYVLESLQRGLS